MPIKMMIAVIIYKSWKAMNLFNWSFKLLFKLVLFNSWGHKSSYKLNPFMAKFFDAVHNVLEKPFY